MSEEGDQKSKITELANSLGADLQACLSKLVHAFKQQQSSQPTNKGKPSQPA
jgi:hypothetical protein